MQDQAMCQGLSPAPHEAVPPLRGRFLHAPLEGVELPGPHLYQVFHAISIAPTEQDR